jgi:hypothetical protein
MVDELLNCVSNDAVDYGRYKISIILLDSREGEPKWNEPIDASVI